MLKQMRMLVKSSLNLDPAVEVIATERRLGL